MISSPFQADEGGVPIGAVGISPLGNSNAKLLNRFYEPLHLLSMLNADRGPGEVDLPSSSQSRGFKLIWRRFLDDISWLCDNRHGGETVSAVAAQDLPEGIKFWLVSKHEASYHHLNWVLEELKASREQTDEDGIARAAKLSVESILFSKDKVKNYRRFLKVALSRAKEIRPTPENAEVAAGYESLIDELESLIEITNDPLALCHAAKQFSQRKMLGRLMRSNNSLERYSPWSSLWHYVGRLGCWFGKCENLVLTARQFPQLLENAQCEFLALPKEIELPVNKSKADLMSALKRMLPANQQKLVPRLYNQLADMRLYDIPVAFSHNFTDETLKGRVHAEVFLMEHFYFNNFRFLAREKYIGCRNFVLRPSHNNVYITWIPPLMSQLDEEPPRKHNLDIMNQMNAYMRRDIKEEIEERMPRRDKAPDSTSGVVLYSFLSQ